MEAQQPVVVGLQQRGLLLLELRQFLERLLKVQAKRWLSKFLKNAIL